MGQTGTGASCSGCVPPRPGSPSTNHCDTATHELLSTIRAAVVFLRDQVAIMNPFCAEISREDKAMLISEVRLYDSALDELKELGTRIMRRPPAQPLHSRAPSSGCVARSCSQSAATGRPWGWRCRRRRSRARPEGQPRVFSVGLATRFALTAYDALRMRRLFAEGPAAKQQGRVGGGRPLVGPRVAPQTC